jgi:hypothetical protein
MVSPVSVHLGTMNVRFVTLHTVYYRLGPEY